MKQLLYISLSIILLALIACSNNKKSETTPKEDEGIVLDQIAQNDYFRIQYPSFYEVYDQIDYPIFSTDELAAWCKAHPDSVPTNDMNEFYLGPKFDNPDMMNPEIYIVLSRTKMQLPIRSFAEFSISTKSMVEQDMKFVGYTDIDSLTFAGYPALSYGLFYEAESGDTIVQQQIIVQREDYSLFYINNKFNKKNSAAWELGAQMLETFEFEPLAKDSL